ncbi:MAG: EthD family reductase [Actinomycetota bacterium]|nr:EthD family reductase [Actinomycetota bacterium]
MIKYVALYRTPPDVADFDEHYFRTHVPLANTTPGLVRTELARVLRNVTGDPSLHVMAELYFASYDDLRTAFASPEWAASGANLAEWGGLELVSMHIAAVVDDEGTPI